MKELLETIARALVDDPDSVDVTEVDPGDSDGDDLPTTVYELRVAPDDLGKVIGRQGKTARSIRSILATAGGKHDRRIELEIVES